MKAPGIRQESSCAGKTSVGQHSSVRSGSIISHVGILYAFEKEKRDNSFPPRPGASENSVQIFVSAGEPAAGIAG
ncbi:MAG: hypothetical protein ABW007_25555 [Chitinophagaceae bacterium]